MKALGILLVCLPVTLFAQFVSKNQVAVSVTGAYYFNKGGVHQNGISPDPIEVRNSVGYGFGTSYARVLNGRFLAGFSLDFGGETLRGNIHRDLSNYDLDNARQQLNGFTFDYSLNRTTHFFSPKLFVGIQEPITKTSELQILAGVGEKFTRRENPAINQFVIQYPYDDGSALNTTEFGYYNTNIKEDKLNLNPFAYNSPLLSASLELRIIQKMVSLQNHFSFFGGVIVERGIGITNSGPRYIQINSRASVDDVYGNYDWYSARNFSIGIKIGVGIF